MRRRLTSSTRPMAALGAERKRRFKAQKLMGLGPARRGALHTSTAFPTRRVFLTLAVSIRLVVGPFAELARHFPRRLDQMVRLRRPT